MRDLLVLLSKSQLFLLLGLPENFFSPLKHGLSPPIEKQAGGVLVRAAAIALGVTKHRGGLVSRHINFLLGILNRSVESF